MANSSNGDGPIILKETGLAAGHHCCCWLVEGRKKKSQRPPHAGEIIKADRILSMEDEEKTAFLLPFLKRTPM